MKLLIAPLLLAITLPCARLFAQAQETPPKPAQPAKVNPAEKKIPEGVVDPKTGLVGPNAQPEVTNKGKPVPKGCWFKKIHLDYGKHVENTVETLRDKFEFVNETGKEQRILSLMTSCKCQRIKLKVGDKVRTLARKQDQTLKEPVTVPAGVPCVIEMDFDVSGGAGRRVGDIRIETSDPAMPSMTLTAEATMTAAFKVVPEVVQLGSMDPSEQRQWEVKVHCLIKNDWKITRPDSVMPEGMKVTSIEPSKVEGKTVYTIKGSYGPGLTHGAFGGYLLFHTDNEKHNVQVIIAAEVKETVKLEPRFFSLRSFPRSAPPTRAVYLWAIDGSEISVESAKVLKLRGVKEDDLIVRVIAPNKNSKEMLEVPHQQKMIPANRTWKVEIALKPGFKGRGAVRGEIEVKSKSSKMPLTFKFNGFPRGR
ncbi:MAG: hypothetical protein CSA62_12770 [Planctomycetota bacterium]|nr:MAG: hypothetical protein CSA62_12770 [Planctomycetota bacterium]